MVIQRKGKCFQEQAEELEFHSFSQLGVLISSQLGAHSYNIHRRTEANPYRRSAFCFSLCEILCVLLIRFIGPCSRGALQPWWLSYSLCVLFHQIPWSPKGKNLTGNFHYISIIYLSAQCLAVGLCFCCHQLPEEVFLRAVCGMGSFSWSGP